MRGNSPFSGISVNVANLKLIKDYRNDTLHKVKTDKADARKITTDGIIFPRCTTRDELS